MAKLQGGTVIYGSGTVQTTLLVQSTTAASSTSTGALQVVGGVGIGGSLYVGGTSTVLSTLASTGSVSSNALYVAGGVGIGGSLLVTGPATFQNSITFSGTTTYVLSTNTVYTDNILEIHYPSTGTAWTVNDGKDIGFRFHYYNAGDLNAGLVLANDSKYLEWYKSGTEDSTSTFAGGVYGTFKTGSIVLTNTTASVSTTTGALTVVGGVGVGGDLYAANIYTNGTRTIPLNIQEFTATANQTTFTVSGGYTVGTVQVFANGINLGSGDITASNGTTVILSIARKVNDIIRIISGGSSTAVNNIQSFSVAMSVAMAM